MKRFSMSDESHTTTRSSARGRLGRGVFLGLLRIVFPKVVAMVYTAGTVVHILRLIFRFGLTNMPFEIDWVVVSLGPIGVIGLIVFSRHVYYRGRWEHITHWLIIIHLFISAALHAWILAVRSHEALSIFGYSYSYFAALYFAFFAWRSWTIRFHAECA